MFLMNFKHNTRLNLESHKKIDVYAYAITVYEIATKSDAWNGLSEEEISASVVARKHPVFPASFDTTFNQNISFKSLICECWTYDFNLRPGLDEIESRIARVAGDLNIPNEVTESLFQDSISH